MWAKLWYFFFSSNEQVIDNLLPFVFVERKEAGTLKSLGTDLWQGIWSTPSVDMTRKEWEEDSQ